MPSETGTTTTYIIELWFDEALNTKIFNMLRSKSILEPVETILTLGVAHVEAQTCSSALSILENVLCRYVTIQERFPVRLNGVELNHPIPIISVKFPRITWPQIVGINFAKITLFNSRDQLFKAIRDLWPIFDSEFPLIGFAYQVALVELSPNPRDLSILPLRERAASNLVDA
ncbi:hypothetical protein WN943_014814 [Citrus x changshan-huyou]